MPVYFFNIRRNGDLTPDVEGYDLPDLDAVREEAIEGARTITAHDVRSGRPINLGDSFEITDEDGNTVQTVTFAEAVPISNG